MKSRSGNMFIDGYEESNDVDRIYKLIESLKKGRDARFVPSVDEKTEWVVNFLGTPSIRHANRISIFKEFLADHLSAEIRVFGAKKGSVLVEYSPESADLSSEYIAAAKKFAEKKSEFIEISKKLGIQQIYFGDIKIL